MSWRWYKRRFRGSIVLNVTKRYSTHFRPERSSSLSVWGRWGGKQAGRQKKNLCQPISGAGERGVWKIINLPSLFSARAKNAIGFLIASSIFYQAAAAAGDAWVRIGRTCSRDLGLGTAATRWNLGLRWDRLREKKKAIWGSGCFGCQGFYNFHKSSTLINKK